jgi:hypothetical protein
MGQYQVTMPRKKAPSNSVPDLSELVKKVKSMTRQVRQNAEIMARQSHRMDQDAHQAHLKADDVANAESAVSLPPARRKRRYANRAKGKPN